MTNLESHFSDIYPYQHLGKYFQFTTAQEIVVTVHLFRDAKWFPNNPEIDQACSFFILTDRPSMGLDVRLRNTVLDILINFLQENEAIIIYHCDPVDGRGHQRFMKFNRWFNLITGHSIEKHDRKVVITDLSMNESGDLIRTELPVYASILLRKSHPDYKTALRLFHSGDMDKSGKL